MRRLGLLLGVVVLAACGSSTSTQPESSPAQVISQAAAKLDAAGSARIIFKGNLQNKEFSKHRLPFRGKGITRFDATQSWLWVDLSKVLPTSYVESLPGEERAFARAYFDTPGAWEVEYRYRGKATWMLVPAFTSPFGGKLERRRWIALDRSGFSENWLQPRYLAAYLHALANTEELDTGDVGGRSTVHYRGRVQLASLASQARGKDRAGLRKEVRQIIAQTGKRTLPFEVWIDGEGLPRRFRITALEPRPSDEKYPTTIRLSTEILEYGVAVHVQRPHADEVMSETEMNRRFGG